MNVVRSVAWVGLSLFTLGLLACDDHKAGATGGDAVTHDDDHADAKPPASGHGAGGAPAANGGKGGQSGHVTNDAGAEQDAGEAASADSSAFEIRFKALVGARDFACGETYPGQGTKHTAVTPQDLRFYVQEVTLIGDDDKRVPLTFDARDPWQTQDVALLDFEDASGSCFGDAATNHSISGHAPTGHFHGIEFVIGVPDALNHGDPVTLPAPLRAPGMSWNWLLGFRFIKLELGAGANDEDAGASSAALHVGSVACSGNPSSGNVTCKKPNRNRVQLDGFDPAKNVVAFDIGAVFANTDLSKDATCHSADDVCDSMFRSIGIDYASGMPGSTQSAFHVQ